MKNTLHAAIIEYHTGEKLDGKTIHRSRTHSGDSGGKGNSSGVGKPSRPAKT
jgi:hypothetical protein